MTLKRKSEKSLEYIKLSSAKFYAVIKFVPSILRIYRFYCRKFMNDVVYLLMNNFIIFFIKKLLINYIAKLFLICYNIVIKKIRP